MRRALRRAFLLLLAAAPLRAEPDVYKFYQEEAQVYTASRRPEPAWRAPVAVDVVTAEEIAAYGWQSLADILRYRVGLDVSDARSADGNRAAVSARGFTRDFVAEMLVLVDGRSVYTPLFGGVYWDILPVQIQDIERIEIVRGPNAALYGSNAVLGVINIITRKPGSKAAGMVSARGGNRMLASAESAEAGAGLGGVRVSHSYEAVPGRPAPDGVVVANDFYRSNKLNLRARLNPGSATEVELLAGGSDQTLGVPGFAVDSRTGIREQFSMIRAAHHLESAGTVEVLFARSEQNINADRFLVRPVDVRVYQYDAELLHRSAWADEKVHSALGGSYRLSGVYSDQLFAGHPAQKNEVVRGFTHQSVKISDTVTAVAGASIEDSSLGGLQPSWQAAALFSPNESHALRLSYSRAPTIPNLFSKYGDFTIRPGVQFISNATLAPQQLTSWEAGWANRAFGGALKSELTLYYMTITDRIFQYLQSAAPRITAPDNRNRASARGVELSEEYTLARGRVVFANYTFEKILDDKGRDAVGTELSRGTPLHKVNLGVRAALGRGFSATALMGYKDNFTANSTTRSAFRPIPRSFRVDARLSWTPRPGWELFLAGMDLLQPYRVETADGTASPRRFEGGATMRFGL